MKFRVTILFQNTTFRYLFGIAAVATAYALHIWLIPLTGTAGPWVLFFAAVLATSLFAGVGPAICAVLFSMPFGAYAFVVGVGYSIGQASFQSLLFAVDGIVVIYLASLTKKRTRSLQDANRQLRESEEKYRTLFDSIDEGFCVVEVLFDDADNTLDCRFLEVNRAFEKQTASNAVGRRMREIAPALEEHWFQIYGQIALTGESRRFENPALGRFYDVYAFRVGSPGQRQVAILFNDITERKRAEEELRAVSAELRQTLHTAGTALTHCSRGLRFLSVNPAYARLIGRDVEQIVGRPIVEVIGQGAFEIIRPRVERVLSGERVEYEEELPIAGERKYIQVVHTPERDASGNVVGWVSSITDVSARKRIERTLQESEERFRLTIDEAPIGIALVALDGRFVRVNRALCEIVGYSSAELTELTVQAITHPDDLDADLALRGQLARGEIPRYHLDEHYIRKDGAIVDTQLDCSILRSREGAPLYYIAQIEDITDRKQAEAALKDSEQRLGLALDSAQMGMWDLDLLTDTSVRSLRHDEVFGYSAAVPSWGAAVFMTHVVPEDREVAKHAFEKAFVSDNFEMECRIRWADESIHWISARGRVYRNPKGDPVRMLGTVLDVTEQKRAQEALQRSEREFRQLAEAMPQIVWATTADGMNIYFNQQWVDYTGLTLEESRGEGWLTPFHPDDRQRAWDAWQRATKRREIYSLECRLRRADGVYQWWLNRGVPLLNANGEISKWFGTCTDIEQIKVAEQRLKESEAQSSGIISVSEDAIISIDAEQRIIIFNNGAEQVFGYSQAEAIGTPLENLIPERFRKIHRQHVERFASDAVTMRRVGDLVTVAGLRKNGEEFPAEAAISRLQVGDKTLLTVSLRDITERKRREKEQQVLTEAGAVLATSLEYEETLSNLARLVVQNLADWSAVDVMDEEGRLSRLKVASADPDQAALCAVLEQLPPDRDLPHLMRSVIESKRPIVVEQVTSEYIASVGQGPKHLQALQATGVTSFVAVPLFMRGQPLGALFLGSSTPSRAFGQRDLRLAEALADRAAMAIENAGLYRASVHASQLRDHMLGVVAHDLRNPLSTILLQTSLRRQVPDPERRSDERIEVIHRVAERMNRLIQDLLDVALMESAQLTIERTRQSACGLIAEAVDMQRPLASSSSLELRVEVDPDVGEVSGDRDRLLQVFENLIGNAIKFTQAGGRITAGATSRDDEVIFWVADTGCGIPSENLPRVFDRFWQATRTGRLGAGLGLPITKGIVEAHGGRIWVESTAGSGSTFFFTIPRVTPTSEGGAERAAVRARKDSV